jgi:hypothetical protein
MLSQQQHTNAHVVRRPPGITFTLTVFEFSLRPSRRNSVHVLLDSLDTSSSSLYMIIKLLNAVNNLITEHKDEKNSESVGLR